MGANQNLEWTLNWPDIATRRGAGTLPGYSKRIYEEFGCRNVLTVHFPQAGEAGKEASRRLRATDATLTLGGRVWQKPKARLCSNNRKGHAMIFFAATKAPEDPDIIQERLDGVNNGPLLNWHFDVRHNLRITCVLLPCAHYSPGVTVRTDLVTTWCVCVFPGLPRHWAEQSSCYLLWFQQSYCHLPQQKTNCGQMWSLLRAQMAIVCAARTFWKPFAKSFCGARAKRTMEDLPHRCRSGTCR